jgi:hypothetical protein
MVRDFLLGRVSFPWGVAIQSRLLRYKEERSHAPRLRQ